MHELMTKKPDMEFFSDGLKWEIKLTFYFILFFILFACSSQGNMNLVNEEAYEPTLHGEQGGVALLVHAWIQQNQIEKVSSIQNAYNPYFYCWIYQGFTY